MLSYGKCGCVLFGLVKKVSRQRQRASERDRDRERASERYRELIEFFKSESLTATF